MPSCFLIPLLWLGELLLRSGEGSCLEFCLFAIKSFFPLSYPKSRNSPRRKLSLSSLLPQYGPSHCFNKSAYGEILVSLELRSTSNRTLYPMSPLNAFFGPSLFNRPLFPPSLMNSIDAIGDFLGLSRRRVRVIQELSFQPRHWTF